MTSGAVFLDRDGVLNAAVLRDRRPHPPQTAADVVILPGVRAAIDAFRRAGLKTIVITNQPDVARGTSRAAEVDAVNAHVARATGVDAIIVCPHDDDDGCACRKPLPGMILDAASAFDVDLARSVLVGDRWRDIEAGKAAGIPTVLVDRGYAEQSAQDPTLVVDELSVAVPWILGRTKDPTA
ncbi:MAG: D-glycero-alpha-D-manno-heptose-1,7-bisphosphate 7-phosphatase [Ilumatobacteraceae bacterium]